MLTKERISFGLACGRVRTLSRGELNCRASERGVLMSLDGVRLKGVGVAA